MWHQPPDGDDPCMATNPRRWRHLTVWLHVMTSVGWMSLALVLLALLALAATTSDHDTAAGATSMAHYLDNVLLAPLANASATTGLMLSVGTAWGLTHHRWVLTKFVITLVQLNVGIFVLSGALDSTASAVRLDDGPVPVPLILGSGAMAGAIAFQAWLSVAKPGHKTRWARARGTGQPIKLPTAPPWVFTGTVLTTATDIAVGTAVGSPTPALSVLMLIVAVLVRQRALRGTRRPRPLTAANDRRPTRSVS